MSSFERVKPIDFFSQLGRPAPLDLMGPRLPKYVTQAEREEAEEAMRKLWARVRVFPGVVTELPTVKASDLTTADVLITLDSLSMHEDQKQLTVVHSKRRTAGRPMFKLAFDPHASGH
ncbi:hypothetical protein [Xanthomonas phage RTH11]|nr:hypothetical protein [Xanthomonas phage RTH11]